MDYWRECIEIAFEDAGIQATPAQIEIVAGVVEGGHENYGMAFGHDVASSNLASAEKRETDDLRMALRFEQEKSTCRTCNGTGRIITRGGTMQFDSQCYKCHGDGKIHPTQL